jgi:hypothetical protein
MLGCKQLPLVQAHSLHRALCCPRFVPVVLLFCLHLLFFWFGALLNSPPGKVCVFILCSESIEVGVDRGQWLGLKGAPKRAQCGPLSGFKAQPSWLKGGIGLGAGCILGVAI